MGLNGKPSVVSHADAGTFPHPLSGRTFKVAVRTPPAKPAVSQPIPHVRAPRRSTRPRTHGPAPRVLHGLLRFLVFYLTTASLIVVGIGVHEYSHYAAHEGFGMPALTYSDGVAEAQAELTQVERSRSAGREVLVQQPRETTIVFFPNTFLQAAGLGLLPAQAYQDDGVLASTFFHLDAAEIGAMRERGGTMPTAVVAAPLWVATLVFFGALAWALARPNLFNKALLVAFAVQLGDVGHHASAFGMNPEVFYGLSTLVILGAAILVGLRMRSLRDKEAGSQKTGDGIMRPLPPPPRRQVPMPSRHSRFRPAWDLSRAASGAARGRTG